MDDKQLIKMAYELDNVFAATCNKYGVNPMALSAVVLARLFRLNQETDSEAEFRKLLSDVASKREVDSISLH